MASKYAVELWLNKTLNNWTVLGEGSPNSKGELHWRVQCICGDVHNVRANHVVRGLSRGCRRCRGQALSKTASPYWRGGKFLSGTILTVCRLSAKHRGLEFDLTIEHLEDVWEHQQGLCYYTGTTLILPQDSRSRPTTSNASIDRKDSSRGYVDGNVQWVTKEINFMKMSLSEDRFIDLCKQVSQWKGGSCGI